MDPSDHVRIVEAAARRARETLRAAALDFDRASAHGRGADEALDLHRGLIAGRWTLADTFETGGTRFLIARRHTATPAPTPELSVRETQVAMYAAMGHPLKRIAYELGLSDSCVATYLRRALVKLRLPDRLALARGLDFFGASLADPVGAPA